MKAELNNVFVVKCVNVVWGGGIIVFPFLCNLQFLSENFIGFK